MLQSYCRLNGTFENCSLNDMHAEVCWMLLSPSNLQRPFTSNEVYPQEGMAINSSAWLKIARLVCTSSTFALIMTGAFSRNFSKLFFKFKLVIGNTIVNISIVSSRSEFVISLMKLAPELYISRLLCSFWLHNVHHATKKQGRETGNETPDLGMRL